VGENRPAMFLLTYEVSYIPEINVWRNFLIKKEEIPNSPLLPSAQ
jgi:hypothetical protein